MALTLLLFISSPGDVRPERDQTRRVVERLQDEFGRAVKLQPYYWEDKPQRATSGFQQQIIPPSRADIMVCILWTRLGTPLSEPYYREDGTPYRGTEWEFEEAVRSYDEQKKPDLLVYRKTATLFGDVLDEKAASERWEQKRALNEFFNRRLLTPDGTFKGAFRTFETLDEFNHLLETHLRELILDRLPDHFTEDDAASGPIEWYRGSPYRALEVFEAAHAPIFFGRTRAIGDTKVRLIQQARNGCAFLLIFGASGCGKSSLLRAGILPSLTRLNVGDRIGLWRACVFRPGDALGDLLDGLAAALLGEEALPELAAVGFSARALAVLFRSEPQETAARVVAGLDLAAEGVARQVRQDPPPEMRLAVAVDQMEDLFALDRVDAPQRDQFVAALDALARSGRVWVIGAMRNDFRRQSDEIPSLAELKKGGGEYDLAPPTPPELRQIIIYPGRAAGLRFEVDPKSGERLDDVLHAAADPTALPLLELTLDTLYQRCSDGVLTFEAYRQLQEMDGVLAQHAESVFNSADPSLQASLPSLLRALVTVGHDDKATAQRRRVRMDRVSSSPATVALMRAFIQARLLVTDRAEDGTPVVGLAHDALLRWPRVEKWLTENRPFLSRRARAEEAMDRWETYGRHADDLLSVGTPLDDAKHLVAEERADLSPGLVQFIEMSLETATRARNTKGASWGLGAVFLIGVTVALGILWQWSTQERWTALKAISQLASSIPSESVRTPGDWERARSTNQKSLSLLAESRETRETRRAKGVILQHLGDVLLYHDQKNREAKAYYEQATTIGAKLFAETHEARDQFNLAIYWGRTGDVYNQQDDLLGARNAYTESLRLARELAERNAGELSAEARRDLPARYISVGDILLDLADQQDDAKARREYFARAREAYRKSLALAMSLAELDKDNAEFPAPRDLVFAHERMGEIHVREGRFQDAQSSFQASLKAAREYPEEKWDSRTKECVDEARANLIQTRRELGSNP